MADLEVQENKAFVYRDDSGAVKALCFYKDIDNFIFIDWNGIHLVNGNELYDLKEELIYDSEKEGWKWNIQKRKKL